MPSASTSISTTMGPPPPTSSSASQLEKIIEQTLDPFKQAITVLEHKVRNLEKRKGKLDSYKQEQEQGKELNADQLTAVAKYNEVAQQLDLAREMMKQLAQIQTETYRSLKKQQKKDQAERALVECEKYKQMLTLQSCLRQMSNPRVRDDFQSGKDCALTLKESDFAVIDELQHVASLELNHPDFQTQLHVCAEQLFSLCEEKSTVLTGQTTFKDAKALLLNIATSGYFDPTKAVEVEPEPEPVEAIIVEPSATAPSSVIEILSAQSLTTQESTYQFIQESQIDIESPHMDPAVVAVSSYAPPQPHTQRNEANSNVFNTSSSSGLNPTGRSQTHPGDQIDDMNLNHLSIKEPEEIDEWNTQIVHPPSGSGASYSNANNSANQESEEIDEGEPQDTYDRSGRGGFRRGVQSRPRGVPMNGYRGPRMPSRGQGGNGGYQNGRGSFQSGFRDGYYQRDRYERDDFGRDDRVFERDEQFDRTERYDRAGFERGERFDRGERFGERYDRGDNDMGEFRAPRPGSRSSGPGSSGGAGPGYSGNRGGNPYGGQGQGQRGMIRPLGGSPQKHYFDSCLAHGNRGTDTMLYEDFCDDEFDFLNEPYLDGSFNTFQQY